MYTNTFEQTLLEMNVSEVKRFSYKDIGSSKLVDTEFRNMKLFVFTICADTMCS